MKSTSSLHKLQKDFAARVFDEAENGFEREIRAAGLPGHRRLQVYRSNVYSGLCKALEAVYPVIQKLTGDEFFTYMSRQYIRWYPSVSGDLHHFGNKFAEFTSLFEPAGELVYLPDVARLEWACHEVLRAAPSNYIDLERLRQIDPTQYSQLRFTLNPASRLLRSDYPVLAIWKVNQREAVQDEIDFDSGGTTLLVIRRKGQVQFQSLADGEFAMLFSLSRGDDFSTACERAQLEEPGCAVAELFQSHVQAKTLTGFSV